MGWEGKVIFILLAIAASLAFLAGYALINPVSETKVVYVDHPKGVPHLPKYDEREEFPGTGISKMCRLYANFEPDEAQGFKVGQRLVSDCSIVKTGPKG